MLRTFPDRPVWACSLLTEKDTMMINRRTSVQSLVALAAAVCIPMSVWAAEEAPDALIKRMSADVLETIKADPALRHRIRRSCKTCAPACRWCFSTSTCGAT